MEFIIEFIVEVFFYIFIKLLINTLFFNLGIFSLKVFTFSSLSINDLKAKYKTSYLPVFIGFLVFVIIIFIIVKYLV